MVVADQEMVQADHFKRDQDDFMFPLIKTSIYLARFILIQVNTKMILRPLIDINFATKYG